MALVLNLDQKQAAIHHQTGNWLNDQRRYAMSNNLTCRVSIDHTKQRSAASIPVQDPNRASMLDQSPTQVS